MARKLKVDMSDVESFVKCEEGEHIAFLKEITEGVSSSGSDMLTGKFEVIKGSSAGAIVYERFPLVEKALWKLKGLLDCFGMKSEGRLVLDLDKMEGKKVIINVLHEEYEGSLRAKIEGFKKLESKVDPEDNEDDFEEDEEEEEVKPTKKKPKTAPAKKKPAPVEEEEEDEDEEEEEEEVKPVKKKAKKKPAPVIEEDEDEDEEEEEEEEEVKPVKKKKPAPKPAAPAKKKKPVPVEDDEDEDWEDD